MQNTNIIRNRYMNSMGWTLVEIKKYFIVLFVLFYNVNPFFTTASKEMWFILLILLLSSRKELNLRSKKIFYIILLVYILIIIQGVLFGGFSPAAIYKPIMIFFTPYLLYRYLGIDFFKKLFNILYFLSVFVTIIWIVNLLFHQVFIDAAQYVYYNNLNWDIEARSLLFYTVEPAVANIGGLLITRNSGFFHEPGAFSIYLMFAILINVFLYKKYFNKRIILLVLILLTTFSTVGYLMLFIYLIYSLRKVSTNLLVKPIIFVGMLFLMYSSFINTEFLSRKIEERYTSESVNLQYKAFGRGRFYSFARSIMFIKQNPIIGRGILTKVNYKEILKDEGSGYGFTRLFMIYGSIFGLIYMFLWYKGFKVFSAINKLPISFAIIAFIIINLGLLSQAFFLHISFVYIFILGLFESGKSKGLDTIGS